MYSGYSRGSDKGSPDISPLFHKTHSSIGNLRMRVFETRTATGREHFARQGSGVFQIFILIISNGEKILSNVNVVEKLKGKTAHFRFKNARA